MYIGSRRSDFIPRGNMWSFFSWKLWEILCGMRYGIIMENVVFLGNSTEYSTWNPMQSPQTISHVVAQ